ncbi:hypothetical protein QOT17_015042 [Balamuthia mandrillaris]
MTVLQSSTFEELLKEGVITPDDPLFAKVLTDTNGDILKEGHLFFKKRKSKKDEKKVAHGRSSLPPQPSPPDEEKDKDKEAAAEVDGGGKEEEQQLQKNRKKSGWQKAYVVLYPSHMSVSIYAPPALHMKSSFHIPLKAARCFRPNQENKTPKTNNNNELRKQNIFSVQVFRSGQVPPPSSPSPAQQKRKKEQQAITACLSPVMIVHPHKNKNKKKEDLYYFAPCGNSPVEESEAWMRAIQNRNKKHLFIPDNVVTTVVKCSRPVPGPFPASSSASSSAPSTPLHHNHNKKNNKQATKEQATGYRARGSPLVVGKTAAAVKSPIPPTRKQQPPRPHPRTPQPKQQRQSPKASPMKQGRGGATPTSGAFTPPPAPSRLLSARPSPTTTVVNCVEKQKKMNAVVGGAEGGFRTPPPRPAPPSMVQQLAAVRSSANVASPRTPPTTSPMNGNQQHMSGGKGRTRTVKDLNEFWNSPSAATGNSPLILESTLRRLAAPDLSPKKTCKRKISFSQVVHPGEPAYDQNEDDWNEKYQQLVSDLRQVEKEVQEKLGKNYNKGNNKGKELQTHEDSAMTKQQEIVLKRAVKEKQIALFKFLNKFLDAAKYVSKTIVDEIHLLPSLKTFAPMEGELYSHHGLFVFISGALCECRKDEMDAMKLAAQELKGNMAFQRAAASGLHTALTCIVDYKGFRVVVMAVLPSLSQQTLVYGQLSETQFKDDHPLVREKLEEVGKTIPLMPHTIYYSEGKILKIATSSFITVHQSKEDNRFYVLNLARLFPPDPSLALRSSTASSTFSPSTHKLPVPPLSATPSSASASSSEARLSLSCFPALSNAAPRSTFSSSFDIASSQQLAFFRPEFLLSRHHQQIERDEPCFAPLSADAFQEKEIGGFRGALGDEKKVDIIMEYQKHQERIVQASTYLKENVIPAFVAKLCSLEIIPTSSETFTQQLHECGINVRYLPLLAAHPMLSPSVASTLFTSSSSTLSFASCDPFLHVRQFLVVEMVARTCKHILKQKWRQVTRRSKYESLQSSALASLPSEQHQLPVLMKNEEGKADATKNNIERKAREAIAGVEKELQWTTVKYFNLVLGRGKESQNYWTQTLRMEVKDKFHFDLLLARIGGQGENKTMAMMVPPLNVIRMLFLSMQHHCGVDFEDDPTYPFDTANHNPIPFHKFRKFRAGLSYNTPMPSLPSSSSNKKDEIEQEEDEMEKRTHQLALHAAAEGLLNDKAARLLTRLAALHLKRRHDHSNSTKAEEHALQCGAAALGVVRKVFCAETSNVYRLLMRTFYFKSLGEQKQLWREVLLCYENCKLVVEWHLGARSPLLLAAHICLADLYREDKQYEKAAQYYKEALSLSELIFGELHPLTAPYLQALAQVYQQMDEPALHDQAELYLFKAQQASDTLSSSFAALLAL